MSMINTSDILETIGMITSENLDVRRPGPQKGLRENL